MIRNRFRKRQSKKSKRYRRGKGILTIPLLIAAGLAAGKAVPKVRDFFDKIKRASRIGIVN